MTTNVDLTGAELAAALAEEVYQRGLENSRDEALARLKDQVG
jgi:hypothetical protein